MRIPRGKYLGGFFVEIFIIIWSFIVAVRGPVMEESPFNPDRMRRAVLAAENSENNEEHLSPSPGRSWMSPRGGGRIEPLSTSPRMSPRGRI